MNFKILSCRPRGRMLAINVVVFWATIIKICLPCLTTHNKYFIKNSNLLLTHKNSALRTVHLEFISLINILFYWIALRLVVVN